MRVHKKSEEVIHMYVWPTYLVRCFAAFVFGVVAFAVGHCCCFLLFFTLVHTQQCVSLAHCNMCECDRDRARFNFEAVSSSLYKSCWYCLFRFCYYFCCYFLSFFLSHAHSMVLTFPHWQIWIRLAYAPEKIIVIKWKERSKQNKSASLKTKTKKRYSARMRQMKTKRVYTSSRSE